jgi:hypothetical protein
MDQVASNNIQAESIVIASFIDLRVPAFVAVMDRFSSEHNNISYAWTRDYLAACFLCN